MIVQCHALHQQKDLLSVPQPKLQQWLAHHKLQLASKMALKMVRADTSTFML